MKQLVKEYASDFKDEVKVSWPIPTLLFLYVFIMHFFITGVPNCPFRLMFGIPCPFCGLSRAGTALLRLDIVDSLRYSLVLPILMFSTFVYVFRRRPLWQKLYKSKVFWFSLIAFVLIYYIIRMILIFPNPPMNGFENPLFFRLFR